MSGQPQNVRSTKVAPAMKDATVQKEVENEPSEKKYDIIVEVYNLQKSHDE